MCSVCEKLKSKKKLAADEQSALLSELSKSGSTRRHQDEVVGRIIDIQMPKDGQDEEEE